MIDVSAGYDANAICCSVKFDFFIGQPPFGLETRVCTRTIY
jgi:hypothetical protein